MTDDRTASLPRGDDYFETLLRLEADCEAATAEYLRGAEEKAPETWARLGTSLALLDALSSCHWGCRGGDHAVEYLLGRTVGSVRATLRLARAGLYDESLNALRTAGEIVNLLTLFQSDPALLDRWRTASPRERYQLARPTDVQRRLAGMGREESSLNSEKYDLLSRIAHGNTSDAPQSHNPIGLPLTAGIFQEAGLLVALNEAALTVALAVLAGVQLVDLEKDRARSLLDEGHALVKSTGAVTLTTVGEALDAQQEAVDRAVGTTIQE
jgi:hypothetical protein